MNTEENKEGETKSQLLSELKGVKAEMREKVYGQKSQGSDEDPEPSKEVSEEVETKEGDSEEAEKKPEVKAASEVEEEDELIRIGDREFKTQAEALKYAESLQYEKLAGDSYNRGIQDAIQAIKPQDTAPKEEENFEEKFYANPKATLQEIKEQAKREVKDELDKDKKREALWDQFLTENPDLRRKDAQRMLEENWDTLGKITDLSKAMKLLAIKTRAEYQEIEELRKPRKELPNKSGQAVSVGNTGQTSVTRTKTVETSHNFVDEIRKNRKR